MGNSSSQLHLVDNHITADADAFRKKVASKSSRGHRIGEHDYNAKTPENNDELLFDDVNETIVYRIRAEFFLALKTIAAGMTFAQRREVLLSLDNQLISRVVQELISENKSLDLAVPRLMAILKTRSDSEKRQPQNLPSAVMNIDNPLRPINRIIALHTLTILHLTEIQGEHAVFRGILQEVKRAFQETPTGVDLVLDFAAIAESGSQVDGPLVVRKLITELAACRLYCQRIFFVDFPDDYRNHCLNWKSQMPSDFRKRIWCVTGENLTHVLPDYAEKRDNWERFVPLCPSENSPALTSSQKKTEENTVSRFVETSSRNLIFHQSNVDEPPEASFIIHNINTNAFLVCRFLTRKCTFEVFPSPVFFLSSLHFQEFIIRPETRSPTPGERIRLQIFVFHPDDAQQLLLNTDVANIATLMQNLKHRILLKQECELNVLRVEKAAGDVVYEKKCYESTCFRSLYEDWDRREYLSENEYEPQPRITRIKDTDEFIRYSKSDPIGKGENLVRRQKSSQTNTKSIPKDFPFQEDNNNSTSTLSTELSSEWTENNCDVSTVCTEIRTLGMKSTVSSSSISIYPVISYEMINPSKSGKTVIPTQIDLSEKVTNEAPTQTAEVHVQPFASQTEDKPSALKEIQTDEISKANTESGVFVRKSNRSVLEKACQEKKVQTEESPKSSRELTNTSVTSDIVNQQEQKSENQLLLNTTTVQSPPLTNADAVANESDKEWKQLIDDWTLSVPEQNHTRRKHSTESLSPAEMLANSHQNLSKPESNFSEKSIKLQVPLSSPLDVMKTKARTNKEKAVDVSGRLSSENIAPASKRKVKKYSGPIVSHCSSQNRFSAQFTFRSNRKAIQAASPEETYKKIPEASPPNSSSSKSIVIEEPTNPVEALKPAKKHVGVSEWKSVMEQVRSFDSAAQRSTSGSRKEHTLAKTSPTLPRLRSKQSSTETVQTEVSDTNADLDRLTQPNNKHGKKESVLLKSTSLAKEVMKVEEENTTQSRPTTQLSPKGSSEFAFNRKSNQERTSSITTKSTEVPADKQPESPVHKMVVNLAQKMLHGAKAKEDSASFSSKVTQAAKVKITEVKKTIPVTDKSEEPVVVKKQTAEDPDKTEQESDANAQRRKTLESSSDKTYQNASTVNVDEPTLSPENIASVAEEKKVMTVVIKDLFKSDDRQELEYKLGNYAEKGQAADMNKMINFHLNTKFFKLMFGSSLLISLSILTGYHVGHRVEPYLSSDRRFALFADAPSVGWWNWKKLLGLRPASVMISQTNQRTSGIKQFLHLWPFKIDTDKMRWSQLRSSSSDETLIKRKCTWHPNFRQCDEPNLDLSAYFACRLGKNLDRFCDLI